MRPRLSPHFRRRRRAQRSKNPIRNLRSKHGGGGLRDALDTGRRQKGVYMSSFLASWKTTLAGLAPLAVTVVDSVDSALHGTAVNWTNVLVSLAVGAVGILSKDFNVGSSATPAAE